MKFRFVVFFVIIFLLSCLHITEQTEHKEYYSNGKLSSQFITDKSNNKNGPYVTYFENGVMRSKGQYLNDKQDGYWEQWFDNGNISSAGNYKNGLKEKEWKFWYKNGRLQQINNFKNGNQNGILLDFFETGELERKGFCKDNYLEGPDSMFYKSGKLLSISNWKGSIENGPLTIFTVTGTIALKAQYLNGKFYGDFIAYDSLGQLDSTQRFSNAGILIDTAKYFRNGKLIKYRISKDGKLGKPIKVK